MPASNGNTTLTYASIAVDERHKPNTRSTLSLCPFSANTSMAEIAHTIRYSFSFRWLWQLKMSKRNVLKSRSAVQQASCSKLENCCALVETPETNEKNFSAHIHISLLVATGPRAFSVVLLHCNSSFLFVHHVNKNEIRYTNN